MTTIPSLPQNIDPRIAEILRQKAEKNIIIRKTETPRLRPQNIEAPAVPDPVPLPSVPPVSVPVDDAELVALLDGVLPRLDALIRQAIADVRSDGKLTWAEALALVPEIRNLTSLVVGEMLPQIKGTSAYALVTLVLAVLVRQYVSPHLPAVLRPYLTVQAIRAAIDGLQRAYDNWVKPRLKSTKPNNFSMAPA